MKKFLVFIMVVLMLCGAGFWGYMKFVRPKSFAVFVSSMKHGTVTVEGYEKTGTDNDFRVIVPNGGTVTLNISPEITDTSYYVLSRLLVNGEDVSDSVDMLQYTTEVKTKLSVIAYFKAADRPESIETASKLTMPSLKVKNPNAESEYCGSIGAYGMADPSVVYDSDSGFYYCFATGNRVSRSEDLVNWESLGTYFKTPAGCEDDTVMDFSRFESVKKWSLAHGYDTDYSVSSEDYCRVPSSPEIVKLNDEYFLYFTLTKDKNKNESAIFCVKTDDLASAVVTTTWEDEGLVICTCASDSAKGIKACAPSVFTTDEGDLYMAYGGCYGGEGKTLGGIYLVELDPDNGLLFASSGLSGEGEKIGTAHGDHSFKSGKLIAAPGRIKNDSNVISGVDISYVESTGFYYMLLTYGIGEKSESVRVFRSKTPEGPYVDYNGKQAVTDKKRDQLDYGLKLAGGYSFLSSKSEGVKDNELGRASIGSPELLKTDKGYVMFAHSGVYSEDIRRSLDIRKVVWEDNSWPLVSPEVFRGETTQPVGISEMYGIWDVVVFEKGVGNDNIFSSEKNESFKMTVVPGVAVTEKNIRAGDKLKNLSFSTYGEYSFKIRIDSIDYRVFALAAWDSELMCECVVFTGVSDDGKTVWGKKSISKSASLYTDVFDYALSFADSKTKETYEKKFKKVSAAPSQSRINTLAANLISELLK